MFSVFTGNSAEKFLKKAGPKIKKRLLELFIFLKESPVPASEYDARKLEGSDHDYRIRLSSDPRHVFRLLE